MKKSQIRECWKHMREQVDDAVIADLDGISYDTAARFVGDGLFCCYFDTAREFLRQLYGETEEEADKYDDATVWARYKHVLALAISKHYRYSKINA